MCALSHFSILLVVWSLRRSVLGLLLCARSATVANRSWDLFMSFSDNHLSSSRVSPPSQEFHYSRHWDPRSLAKRQEDVKLSSDDLSSAYTTPCKRLLQAERWSQPPAASSRKSDDAGLREADARPSFEDLWQAQCFHLPIVRRYWFPEECSSQTHCVSCFLVLCDALCLEGCGPWSWSRFSATGCAIYLGCGFAILCALGPNWWSSNESI